MNRTGFTIVELLVVVAIIVLLMALLTPALDKAIYEAEMVLDLANARGIAAAANVYAMDNKRFYPYREDVNGNDTRLSARQDTGVQGVGIVGAGATVGRFQNSSPCNIRDVRGGLAYDMRQRMHSNLALKQFIGCPFSRPVDLADNGSVGNTMITADYSLFFGWQYTNEQGMFKVGDRFGFRGRSFNVLVADVDVFDTGNILSWASHPDEFQLGEMVWQNFGDPARDPQAAAAAYGTIIGDPSFSWTWSRFDCRAVGVTDKPEWWRAPIDDNFAFADLSAKRYDKVELSQTLPAEPDERMSRAAFYRGGGTALVLPRP